MTDAERILITMEANIEAFERAIEERFKPALAKAVAEVIEAAAVEFIEGLSEDEKPSIRVEAAE